MLQLWSGQDGQTFGKQQRFSLHTLRFVYSAYLGKSTSYPFFIISEGLTSFPV